MALYALLVEWRAVGEKGKTAEGFSCFWKFRKNLASSNGQEALGLLDSCEFGPTALRILASCGLVR